MLGGMTRYDEAGGFDVVLPLCRRWHELCLVDPIAAHPFSHSGQHPRHDERLAAYLAEAFGGPPLFTAGYGDESSVRRMHAGSGVHRELDEACLRLFDRAGVGVVIDTAAAERISRYFREATEAMNAYGTGVDLVPDGLPLNTVWLNPAWPTSPRPGRPSREQARTATSGRHR
ncbi:globin domain-containing protein [Tsukamurella soli]